MTTPITIPGSGFKSYYLGVPGAMRLIRVPQDAVTVPAMRGEVQHDLISGGTAVTHRKATRRTWGVTYPGLTPDAADLLLGFYAGVFGDGPFCWVDPAWRNALSADASTFGAVLDASSDWALSGAGQTFTTSNTITPPAAVTSAVGVWHGAGTSSHVGTGTWAGATLLPVEPSQPPYIGVVTTLSLYAKSVSGTPSITVRGRAVLADGSIVNTGTATPTLNGSAWQRVAVTVPAGLTASYLTIDVQCGTAASPDIYLSSAAVEYGVSTPGTWVMGLGIPRVLIPQTLTGQYTVMFARDHGLTLAEI